MTKPYSAPKNECIVEFPKIISIDSCSIWNILCSRILTSVAKDRGLHFVIAEYVRYECLGKKRSNPTTGELGLKAALELEIDNASYFTVAPIDVADLAAVARGNKYKRLDQGEIAAMALAHKINCGFLTDDWNARRCAEEILASLPVRSTPHMVGWLVYCRHLSDSDVRQIIADNTKSRNRRGQIGPYINTCYEHAMGLRLGQQA
jgi:predicted nucleic acid-binding protein